MRELTVEQFRDLLYIALEHALARQTMRVPATRGGFEVLLSDAREFLAPDWDRWFRVEYVEASTKQKAQRVLAEPKVTKLCGDGTCPCQDGDACHYEAAADTPAMARPSSSLSLREYVNVWTEPFLVLLLDCLPDEDGMVKARRLRDGQEAWVHPHNLREVPE